MLVCQFRHFPRYEIGWNVNNIASQTRSSINRVAHRQKTSISSHTIAFHRQCLKPLVQEYKLTEHGVNQFLAAQICGPGRSLRPAPIEANLGGHRPIAKGGYHCPCVVRVPLALPGYKARSLSHIGWSAVLAYVARRIHGRRTLPVSNPVDFHFQRGTTQGHTTFDND